MKKLKTVLCTIIILKLIWTTGSTPIEEINFENIKQFISKNDDHPSSNQHSLNVHGSDHDYTSICWAESLIITENKLTKNKTTSKSYSIILDTPEKLRKLHNESENATCIEILEHNAKPRKALNFTTLKETDEYIVKEHKTLFCGAGPVLSHQFIVWPKLNRRQIEISINPLSSTKWKNCNTNSGEGYGDGYVGEISNVVEKSVKGKKNEGARSMDFYKERKSEERGFTGKNNSLEDLSSSEEDISLHTGAAHGDKDQIILGAENHNPMFNLFNPDNTIEADGENRIKSLQSSKMKKKLLRREEDKVSTHSGGMFGNGEQHIGTISSSKTNKKKHLRREGNAKSGTTEGIRERILPSKQFKPVKNKLLRQNVNCTVDKLGTCNEMIKKSNSVLGYSHSSQAVLGKWFFLDHIDTPLDSSRSFMLKIKVIVNMEKLLVGNIEDDDQNTELVIEEDCLYVIPKN